MNAVQSAMARSEHETLHELTLLFARLPTLIGFSVLESSTLTAEREAARLDEELSVADVSVQTWPGVRTKTLGAEIAAVLAELLEEHPSARALLRGNSFARAFH